MRMKISEEFQNKILEDRSKIREREAYFLGMFFSFVLRFAILSDNSVEKCFNNK